MNKKSSVIGNKSGRPTYIFEQLFLLGNAQPSQGDPPPVFAMCAPHSHQMTSCELLPEFASCTNLFDTMLSRTKRAGRTWALEALQRPSSANNDPACSVKQKPYSTNIWSTLWCANVLFTTSQGTHNKSPVPILDGNWVMPRRQPTTPIQSSTITFNPFWRYFLFWMQ